MIHSKTARGHSIQSHDGDVLYAWLRPDPFCCVCAGLDGDHWGEVGLYAGDAGAKKKVSFLC